MVPSHGELHRTGHQDTGGAHDRRATPAAWNGAEVNRVGRSEMEVGVGAYPQKNLEKCGKMWS